MAGIQPPKQIQEFPLALVKNMIMLATSGFGVVVALAWNEAIKSTVATYIDPILGAGSGVVSLFIYAIVMTFLAVIVTMQLAAVEKRLAGLQQAVSEKESEESTKTTDDKRSKSGKKTKKNSR